jgi:hypothetical protein
VLSRILVIAGFGIKNTSGEEVKWVDEWMNWWKSEWVTDANLKDMLLVMWWYRAGKIGILVCKKPVALIFGVYIIYQAARHHFPEQ